MKKLPTILFILTVLFVLLNMAAGYKSAAIRAKRKACFENLSKLQSMYDMGVLDSFKKLEKNQKIPIDLLIEKKLVSPKILCPFEGNFIATYSEGMFHVSCSFHGASTDDKQGNLDPGYSIFYWLYIWIKGIFK